MHAPPPPHPDPHPSAIHFGWYQVKPLMPYWDGPFRIKEQPGLWMCLMTGRKQTVCVPYNG